MRRTIIATALCCALVGVTPGTTATAQVPPGEPFSSDNVSLLTTLSEGAGAISMEFSSDTPHMYLSTLKAIQVYNIANPRSPRLVSALPLPHYQNESMSLGERKNGKKFVIVASTLAAASTRGDVDPVTARFIIVVDVTDPGAPKVVSSLATETRTHTVTCSTRACNWAYSDGRTQGKISIIDLRRYKKPKMAGTYASVVPQGHDQDVDEAGVMWHVGGQGAVALDVSKPKKPVPLGSTNQKGLGSPDRQKDPWNNFILHNSTRPFAAKFKQKALRDKSGKQVGWKPRPPRLKAGNVLLATEEDTEVGPCSPEYGTFQTWHIPYLDARWYKKKDNPKLDIGNGSIRPLDRWYPEATAAGASCSAHYFDFHRAGFVAQGWYEMGTRILDVRNPKKIKQVGYFFAGATESWAAYWVPQRNKKGHVTGRDSNIVYTADPARGVDVLRVKLPKKKRPGRVKDLTAPVLPEWSDGPRGVVPSRDYGYACRIPGS